MGISAFGKREPSGVIERKPRRFQQLLQAFPPGSCSSRLKDPCRQTQLKNEAVTRASFFRPWSKRQSSTALGGGGGTCLAGIWDVALISYAFLHERDFFPSMSCVLIPSKRI